MFYPYKILINKSKGYYTFTTDKNVKYVCSFIKNENSFLGEDFAHKTIDFNLIPRYKQSSKDIKILSDKRIASTVFEIVTKIFKKDSEILLIYICDDMDGKAKVRQRKFRMWFNLFKSSFEGLRIIQIDFGSFSGGVFCMENNNLIDDFPSFFEAQCSQEDIDTKKATFNIL